MKVSCLFILLSYNKSAWRLRCVVSGDPWENFACGEYTHTLRLKSELFDLRVGYANSGNMSENCHIAEEFSPRERRKKKDIRYNRMSFFFLVTRGRIELPLPP